MWNAFVRDWLTCRQTDRPTDIVTYRAAIAAKNTCPKNSKFTQLINFTYWIINCKKYKHDISRAQLSHDAVGVDAGKGIGIGTLQLPYCKMEVKKIMENCTYTTFSCDYYLVKINKKSNCPKKVPHTGYPSNFPCSMVCRADNRKFWVCLTHAFVISVAEQTDRCPKNEPTTGDVCNFTGECGYDERCCCDDCHKTTYYKCDGGKWGPVTKMHRVCPLIGCKDDNDFVTIVHME